MKHDLTVRKTVIELIDEAQNNGARRFKACECLCISERTVARWKKSLGTPDGRKGPKSPPANKLSELEKQRVLKMVNSPEYRNLSPKQIVPLLVDKGIYLASESTIYRFLREEKQMQHRDKSKPRTSTPPDEFEATGPNQVWSWDITYLPAGVKGMFFFLYVFMDVWSRKIVGWEVHEKESMELSSLLVTKICKQENIAEDQLVIHSDNGGPMKGATMLATLQNLGVVASFSRPRVSDDNPYSEALFRTLKYCPEYPANNRFNTIEEADAWVKKFVEWYNTEHLHSEINYVTPDVRHQLQHEEVLNHRKSVYEQARLDNPNRWTGETRNWESTKTVVLNKATRPTKKVA